MDSRTGDRADMLDVVCWLGSAIAAGDGFPTKSSPSKARFGLAAEGVSKRNAQLWPRGKKVRTYLDYWFCRILSV